MDMAKKGNLKRETESLLNAVQTTQYLVLLSSSPPNY